jgi:hypothetical protein
MMLWLAFVLLEGIAARRALAGERLQLSAYLGKDLSGHSPCILGMKDVDCAKEASPSVNDKSFVILIQRILRQLLQCNFSCNLL